MDRDQEVDQIARQASAQANAEYPRPELSLRAKIGVAIVGLLLVASVVVSVFNSVALRNEVTCNHKLFNAVTQVGDQSRDINKQLFDLVLLGKNPKTGKDLTRADLRVIDRQYDQAYNENTAARNAALNATCHDNNDYPSSPTTSVVDTTPTAPPSFSFGGPTK